MPSGGSARILIVSLAFLILFFGLTRKVPAVTFTTVDFPGAFITVATGINNSGQIVGRHGDINSFHGFLLSGGNFTTIDFPTVPQTWANDINDAGQIAGTYFPGTFHGFVFTPGVGFSIINFPGADSTRIEGINNFGSVVGSYHIVPFQLQGEFHGFLRVGNTFTTIDFPCFPSFPQCGSFLSDIDNVSRAIVGGDYLLLPQDPLRNRQEIE